jgi:hypothetical protein
LLEAIDGVTRCAPSIVALEFCRIAGGAKGFDLRQSGLG